MVSTVTLAIKARRELRVLSLIDSGGLESTKMSTEQSRTVDSVSFMEGGKKRPGDGYHPPPVGSSQLYFIQDDHKSK